MNSVTDDEIASLRARLEAKQDEFLFALKAISGQPHLEKPGQVGDQLFRLLGIVTFWLSLTTRPSRKQYDDVSSALKMLRVVRVSVRGAAR